MLSISIPQRPSIRRLIKSPISEARPPSKERTGIKSDYSSFIEKYPIYKETSVLDRLRKVEFERLEKANEVYVDYMGGCLWPKSLVSGHAAILESGLFGNTHSDSPW